MKNGRTHAKDIATEPILRFLATAKTPRHPLGGTLFRGFENSVDRAMPAGTHPSLVRAKMAALVRNKLVDGCTCGCRGDFELTDRGRAAIGIAPIEQSRPARPTPAEVDAAFDAARDFPVYEKRAERVALFFATEAEAWAAAPAGERVAQQLNDAADRLRARTAALKDKIRRMREGDD